MDTAEGDLFGYMAVDQHDLMPYNDYFSDLNCADLSQAKGSTVEQVRFANVFRAEAEQELYAVSVATPRTDVKVSLSVYVLDQDAPLGSDSDPTAGRLAAQVEQTYPQAGYHRVSLPEGVLLHEGQRYSIVAQLQSEDHGALIPLKNDLTAPPETLSQLGKTSYNEAVVNPGESYIALGDGSGAWGAWEDWASLLEPGGWLRGFMDNSLAESGELPEDVVIAVDNHPLKGYARVMAILDDLKLTAGGREAALSPAFDIREKSYSAAVGSGVSSVTVSAGALNGMTVTVLNPDGATAASGDGKVSAVIPLRAGSNRITVTVFSAENPEFARTYEINVTRASSGGGSGGGSSSGGSVSSNTPSSGTAAVSVSGGEGSVSLSAKIDGSSATVTAPTESQLEAIVGKAKETGCAVIDLSGLPETVTAASTPAETVKAIHGAMEEDGAEFTIQLPGSAVTFDAEALKSIAGQATGADLVLSVTPVDESRLNTKQREALGNTDVEAVFDLSLTSDGKPMASATEELSLRWRTRRKPARNSAASLSGMQQRTEQRRKLRRALRRTA